MTINAKYTHTNIVARDWRKLADFYCDLFGCVLVPPERDLKGEAVDLGTGLTGAHLRGAHLRLPGWGDNGPTLEIYTYDNSAEEGVKKVNRPGFAHIALRVDDVVQARQLVLAAGGSAIGEVVTTLIGSDRQITWCYLSDPEGNVLELQSEVVARQ